MAPAVALLAPDHVRLVGVATHDHRLDPRRQGDEARGNRDADTGGISRSDPAFRAEVYQRPSDTAHHVRTVDGDFARQRFAHGIEDRLMAALGQSQIKPAEDVERRRHRHEVVERRIGIGVLERRDLRVAI